MAKTACMAYRRAGDAALNLDLLVAGPARAVQEAAAGGVFSDAGRLVGAVPGHDPPGPGGHVAVGVVGVVAR